MVHSDSPLTIPQQSLIYSFYGFAYFWTFHTNSHIVCDFRVFPLVCAQGSGTNQYLVPFMAE
jgi:hypothetical protein